MSLRLKVMSYNKKFSWEKRHSKDTKNIVWNKYLMSV